MKCYRLVFTDSILVSVYSCVFVPSKDAVSVSAVGVLMWELVFGSGLLGSEGLLTVFLWKRSYSLHLGILTDYLNLICYLIVILSVL